MAFRTMQLCLAAAVAALCAAGAAAQCPALVEESLDISFEVVAAREADARPLGLRRGSPICVSRYPNGFTLVCVVPASVPVAPKHVDFIVDGRCRRREVSRPYSLSGDNTLNGGTYRPWSPHPDDAAEVTCVTDSGLYSTINIEFHCQGSDLTEEEAENLDDRILKSPAVPFSAEDEEDPAEFTDEPLASAEPEEAPEDTPEPVAEASDEPVDPVVTDPVVTEPVITDPVPVDSLEEMTAEPSGDAEETAEPTDME